MQEKSSDGQVYNFHWLAFPGEGGVPRHSDPVQYTEIKNMCYLDRNTLCALAVGS